MRLGSQLSPFLTSFNIMSQRIAISFSRIFSPSISIRYNVPVRAAWHKNLVAPTQRLYSARPQEKPTDPFRKCLPTITVTFDISHPNFVNLKERPKVTIRTIRRMAKQKEPISMMTAQDYPSGLMVDRAGIDTCLVGDSLAMVTLGLDTTNPVTVDVSVVFVSVFNSQIKELIELL